MAQLLSLYLLAWLPLLGQEAVPQEPVPIVLDDSRFMTEFIKMLGLLGLMVLALIALGWFVRRLNNRSFVKGNDESLIRIIERRDLGPRVNIYLIDVEGTTLVVGETPQGLSRLAEYPTKE